MKTVRLITGTVLVFLMAMLPLDASAHGGHGKKNKKGGPPAWAPAHGYRAQMRHIYFPEYNVYYDRQRAAYIYVNMGRWEVSARLPIPLRRVDFAHATRVGLYMDTSLPYLYNQTHRDAYCHLRGDRFYDTYYYDYRTSGKRYSRHNSGHHYDHHNHDDWDDDDRDRRGGNSRRGRRSR